MFRVVSTAVALVLVGSCEGFTSPIVVAPVERIATTQLGAVSVPLPSDSSPWGGAVGGGATRAAPRGHRDRIQEVLERARSRTGVPVYSPTPTTTKKKENKKTDAAATAGDKSETRQGELPFVLPQLSEQQLLALEAGEIVQEQAEMGRQGSGFVVQDVQAGEEAIWNHCLLDIDSYVENIRTVRSMKRLGNEALDSVHQYGTPSTQRACFTVSKFQLQIATRLAYHAVDTDSGDQPQHYMELTLDNGFTNSVLQSAKGIWYTQRISNNVTRLWLLCDLTVSPLLPPFIVDSAATKAMPRASTWIRPTVAAALDAQEVAKNP